MYRFRAKGALRSLGLFTIVVLLMGTFFASIPIVRADGTADPVASLNVPAEQFIGEPLNFTVSFDNADPDTADVGYGPYIDLILPAAGVDGSGAAVDDGISFIDANYLGAPLVPISPSPFICSGGTFTHPLTGLATPCVDDTQVVVFQLPFGSFAPDQPVADITVNADLSNLSDLNSPLDIEARAGFIYGNDPLDNPGSDPPIVQSSPTSASVTPILLTLIKNYLGPEDETATGPNFLRQYEIVVDIADGQTITDLDVTDFLPNNLAFVQVVSVTPAGSTTVDTPTVDAAANPPDNDLIVNFPTVTGTAAENDVVVVLEFYVPHLDADGANVIVPTTGDDVLSANEARAIGDWTPIDNRDTGGTNNAVADPAGPEHVLEDQSIAIQKGVSNQNDVGATGYTPGDTVEYTLDFQMSDFFIFDTVVITDTFSDGQRLDPSFTPTLEVDGHTFTLTTQGINANNYTVSENYTGATGTPNPPFTLDPAANDGTTTMIFRISDELVTRGQPDGRLIGGCVPPGGTATPAPYCTDAAAATVDNDATQGRIVYRTVIQEAFSDDFPSGDASVDQGDRLDNTAVINGRILDNSDATTPVGEAEDDDTLADIVIERGELTKSIYAINGNTSFTTPVVVQPGDTVTYRIEVTLPSSDIEDLVLTDYLPLPVFNATEVTTFDDTVSAAAPAAGTAKFGPDDTFRAIYGAAPALSTTGPTDNNTVIFTYGDYDDAANTPSRADILFTVTVSDDPFADGLFLTNQVRQTEDSTNQSDNFADAIVQIRLAEPVLNIRKGVVAAYNPDNTPRAGASALSLPAGVTINAPGTCARTTGTVTSGNLGGTFNSNLTGVDAEDKATFAIVVENSGSSANGAYDVQIRDALPANVTLVPGSLCVTDGTGAAMAFTNVGGGTGLFDQGIELTDPGPTNPAAGALDRGRDESGSTVTDGRNIAIVTYDVILDTAVRPDEALINTATLFNYAGTEGGPDHTTEDPNDPASVTVERPTVDKTIVTTNQAHTTGNNVAIGEQVQYQVVVTVPEGTSDSVTLVDRLDTGLAFVSLDSITPSSASVTTDVAGGFAGVLANATISNNGSGDQNLGREATFNFGTVTNSDTDNATDETITLTYTVVVINGGSNDRGDNRNNRADWRWNNGISNQQERENAPNVTIVEPTLQVTKTASPTDADIADTVTFTLDIAHTGASNADAFNVTLEDIIPAGMTYASGTLNHTAGLAPDTLTEAGGTISASWASFPDDGSTSQLEFDVTIDSGVIPGQQIVNSADIAWTSLPGDVTTPQTPNNPLSTERTGDTGDPGGSDNDHRDSDDGTVTVFVPDPQKSIVATSEGHTGFVSGTERVTIGEIVRYRMEVRLAESSAPNFQIQDSLPDGLMFLNDGTATVAFVATGTGAGNGIESSTLGTSAQIAGDETTLVGITPSFVLPDNAVSDNTASNSDTYGSGTDVFFKLGDLMNNDTDADQEFIVIEFNAVVLNDVSNQAFNNATGASTATALDNSFDVIVDGNTIATSPDVTVNVAEPVVEMTKTAVFTPPVDPGDTVSYALLIENAASGDDATAAFDLVVSDALDSNLTFVSASVTNAPGYTNVTDNTTAPNVNFALDRLDPGDSVSIVILATVNSVGSPETIPNSADVTYTSLPEDGTATNPTGSDPTTITGPDTGERDGTGGINDYTDTNDANIVLGSIGDFVWYDIDGDGVQDAGEPGIAGVDVTLTLPGPDGILGNGDDVTVTQTTDASGGYDFTGLPAGDYEVDVDQADVPAGMTTLTTANDPENVTLAAGEDYNDADFGFNGTGSLGDTVWFDQDNDQTQDANEPGIAGVEVTLTWAGPNGTLGDGDDVTYTTTTDANGNYLFDDLPAGDFQVDVNTGTLPTNLTTETYDLDGGLDSTTQTNLTAGQDRDDVDFGYMGTGSIGDTVWYDINGDGILDAGEPGIPGITVQLELDIDGDGTTDFTTTTTTDANGNYLFDNLPAGDYTVTATPPTGTDPTFDADGGLDNTSDYTLGDGEDNTDQDFGYDGTGSIGDTVWFDQNGDGVQDAGEPGIGSVTVQLEVDFDGDGTTDFTTTTTTDANGNYLFDELPAGDYTVTVTPPTGMTNTFDADGGTDNTSDYALGDGEDNLDQDFGYNGTGSIGDTVWYDINGDGVLDAGEPGIPGITVQLEVDLNGDGTTDFTTTTTTDNDGEYLFENLPPGDYTVTATPPTGTNPTFDADGGNDNTSDYPLGDGEDNLDQDFGYDGTGSIGDTVWYDINGDGVLDAGEPGIPGVTVQLEVDFNGDGTTDFTTTTTTDANGNYLFDELPAGDYTVTVTPPTGTNPTFDNDGGNDNTSDHTLGDGEDNLDQDFGYNGTGSIGDTVWYDINGDGVLDAGEPGIPGITVQLEVDLDSDGTTDLTLTTTTDANGNYLFDNLPAGDYTVTATPPTGTNPTFDNDGGNDNTSDHTLGDGEDNLDQDFGYDGTGSIGDTVWYDINGDGVLDAGEPGIPGVTVQLEVDFDGDGTTDFTTTTTTDDNGNYLFDELPAGDYTVTVTPPTGTNPTFDADGGNDNTSDHTLGDGEDNLDQDFGYDGTGSIGDTVWFDQNGDGVQDAGEPGIIGVSVQLEVDFDGDGTIDFTTTTTTDANGNYLFDELPAGDYTVTVTPPTGMDPTFDADGGNDNTSDHTLGDGEDNLDQDFGYDGTGSIGDTVWYDIDGDGVLDVGEPGIPGVTVQLDVDLDGNGTTDFTTTTTTNANGNYLFDNLPAGDYTVTTTPPAGTNPTFDADGGNDNTSDHTLGDGEDNTDQDFGYNGNGSIGDFVWFDINGDGIQDAGEPGIGEVAVQLEVDFDGDGSIDFTTTTTTDANGNYLFDELPAGDYTVTTTPPAGTNPTFDADGGNDNTSDHTLGDGEDNTDQDFGYNGNGSIGDFVWFDINGDGVQDAGEPGAPGLTITLEADLNGNGTIDFTVTTTTDASGNYLFDNLPPGDYTITTDQPAGTDQTFDADGGNDNTSDYTLADGEDNLDQDFGYNGNGSLGDRVWVDLDGDGVQDAGEPGIGGVDVTLIWYGPDGVVGGGDDVTYTDTTNGSGNYLFNDLPPGEYQVDIDTGTIPAGYVETYDLDTTATPSTTRTDLSPGQNRTNVDFGYQDTSTGTGALGDRLWIDTNGDGVQDAGETGINGVTVNLITPGPDGLFGSSDDVIISTVTAGDGNYSFTDLMAGNYRIDVDESTLPTDLSPTFELDSTLDGYTDVSLGTGEIREDIDFGYQEPDDDVTGSLGDRVWEDTNGNGIQDPGEPGIGGVTITLTGAGPDGVFGTADDTTDTTTTGSDGSYSFTGLPADEYQVTIDPSTVPSGFNETYELDASLDGDVIVTLLPGQDRDDVDFGYTNGTVTPPAGAIGDTIWFDANGDGVQDPGETGIPGVEVTLTWYGPDGVPGGGDDVTYTQITDSSGNYNFTGLPAGEFGVTANTSTLPPGMQETYDLDGGNDSTTAVSLTDGQVRDDVDFGYTGTGSIGDRIWHDADNDRVQDASETGLGGVTVNLVWYGPDGVPGGGDDVTYTTTTDSNGIYTFDNLPAGTYDVQVDTGTLPGSITNPTYELDGTLDATTVVDLGTGQDRTDVDFGYTDGDTSANTASIGDRLWIDLNGDGVQDPNEPGLPGVDVVLTWYGPDGVPGGGDDVTYTQTTDANGTYDFTDLPAGEYHIDVDPSTIPSGLGGTYEVDGGIDGQVDITLTEGEERDDVDFGYQGSGSIGDFVWYDINGDGVQDPNEPGLGGINIEILWYGPDGVPGGGDDVTITTTTDSDGGYSVDGLPLGSYQVIIESGVPDGMEGTAELDNSLNGNTQVNLTPANPDRTDVDFGYTGTGSISQNVWMDEDGDGVRDPGEEGIPGVEVTVTWYGPDGVPGGGDDVTITTTTDSDGNYEIPNLPAGNYQVSVDTDTLPPDVRATYDRDGGEDSTTDLTLGVGEIVSDINFGYEDTTPTAIVLVSFTAQHTGDEVTVRWETSAEINTWGFHLYRSTDKDRANAKRVTSELILAEGRGQSGATYSWTDTDVSADETYTYWLEETEVNGTTHEYGPTTAVHRTEEAKYNVFLPFIKAN